MNETTRFDVNIIRVSGTVTDFRRIETKTGTPMVRFAIQCWKERITIVAFKELAEFVALVPGQRVEVRGSIQSTSWKDDQGNARSGFQVIAKDIMGDGDVLIEVEPETGLSALQGGNGRPERRQQALPMPKQTRDRQGVMAAGKDEGLPF